MLIEKNGVDFLFLDDLPVSEWSSIFFRDADFSNGTVNPFRKPSFFGVCMNVNREP